MTRKISRVAVIGAGPAGAIATDALVKEQAFDVVQVFERKHAAGGTWVYSGENSPKIPSLRALLEHNADLPIQVPSHYPSITSSTDSVNSPELRFSDSGVHEYLHSNLPPETMCFTQEPIPKIISERTLQQYGRDAPFRHRAVIREWVENIFVRGAALPLVKFNTTVERAEKMGGRWLLTLRESAPKAKQNHWYQEEFDALVVATGHYSLPYIPPISGLLEYNNKFTGRIKHSKHFRSVDEFRGKNVIVVGGSVSAFDALHEIRTVAKHPVVSSLQEPLPAFGWKAFTHPHVAIKPPISKFHLDGRVEFYDGSFVQDVDLILFATGYDFSFPFLPDVNARIKNRRIWGLYQHIFDITDPTLAFVGMVSGGLTFRIYEWQAVAVARFFAGRAELPDREMLRKWEEERVEQRGNGMSFFDISSDFEGYFEGLRAFAGEPASGTTGRVLPKYDPAWKQAFLDVVVKARLGWWERERRRAEEKVIKSKGLLAEASDSGSTHDFPAARL